MGEPDAKHETAKLATSAVALTTILTKRFLKNLINFFSFVKSSEVDVLSLKRFSIDLRYIEHKTRVPLWIGPKGPKILTFGSIAGLCPVYG